MLEPRAPRPRVFVVGLSKTATTSMDAALARLGLLSAHFLDPLSGQMLRPEDAALFEAMSDTPVAHAAEALAAAHPEARFILTQRPLDGWLRSMVAHFERHHRAGSIAGLRARTAPQGALRAEWRALHHGLYARHADFATAYAVHLARIRGLFAGQPGRLLEFDAFAGDGYAKLGDFLGLPAPDAPFPRENRAPAAGRD